MKKEKKEKKSYQPKSKRNVTTPMRRLHLLTNEEKPLSWVDDFVPMERNNNNKQTSSEPWYLRTQILNALEDAQFY